jgi:hypothetical protein
VVMKSRGNIFQRSAPSASQQKRPSPVGAVPAPRPIRQRKDRQPNWSQQEMSTLIVAKRELFLEEIDAVDGRDLMNPEASKWIRVSQYVM